MAAPKTVLTYPLNGASKDFAIPFEYLARKFVVVTLIGTTRRVLVLNSEYRFTTKKQITTTAAWGPAQGFDNIEIRRVTSATERLVDFSDGSILRAYDLNTAQVQSLHIAEEARDLTADTIGVNNDGDLDARGRRIVHLADGVEPGDAVTLRQEQAWSLSALNSKISAEAARDASQNSANASQASRLGAEAARDTAIALKDTTLTARDVTLTARDITLTAQAATEKVRDSTYSARDTAIAQVALAKSQADISVAKAGESSASALQASTYATQVQYGTVPLFSVQWWGGKRSAIPAGHIPADGQAISRALYIDVTANVAGMMGAISDASWVATPTLRGNWATGDGSTTWRVPDLNGKSAGTVGAPFLRGDGALSSAVAGTIQMDALQGHDHVLLSTVAAANVGGPVTGTASSGGYAGQTKGMASDGTNGTPRSAVETRPLNATGCFIIKVFGAVNNSGSMDANQIATDLGLQNARVTALENTNKKVYTSWDIGPGHVNPGQGGAVAVLWGAMLVSFGGITFDTTNRWFTLPVGGVYRVNVVGLTSGASTRVTLWLNPFGGLPVKIAQNYNQDATLTAFSINTARRLQTGDQLYVHITSGNLYNQPADPFGNITIERIDN